MNETGNKHMKVAEVQVGHMVTASLLGSALVLGIFYLALFRYDNAAPHVDLSQYQVDAGKGIEYGTDQCWVTKHKVAATGWIARKNEGAIRRNVRVVVIDGVEGHAYALSTRLEQRDDVVELLDQRFGHHINYRYAGFAGSLNLPSWIDI